MGHWRDDAACIGIPTEMFFNDGHYGNGTDRESMMAKQVCFNCPVQEQCLADALHFERDLGKNQRAGIWGGYGPRQRHLMNKKMKLADDSLCKNGHVMDDANVYTNPGGYVQCRKCKNIQRNSWKLRVKNRRQNRVS